MSADSRRPDESDPTLFDAIVSELDVVGVERAEELNRSADFVRKLKKDHFADEGQAWTSRTPCGKCDSTRARLIKRTNQNTVRCADCGAFLYNAPKTESGEKPRSVATLRAGIKASQQARIMDRDAGRCILCGSTDDLTIGHLLSIRDGDMLGATADELNSDANLAAMCEACNLGLAHGPSSINPRTYAVIMWRLVQAELLGHDPT